MTVPNINAVGFCAHYSPQGDWAFEHALSLARRGGLQLNVFHFLQDPYKPPDTQQIRLTPSELADLAFERERELRFYYDERAGDYLEVGFRLCYDDSWRELHRCLMIREFQVLFLADPGPGTTYCGKPIAEFAHSFVCPVVLVGPTDRHQIRVNSSAALVTERLGIGDEDWQRIVPAKAFPSAGDGIQPSLGGH